MRLGEVGDDGDDRCAGYAAETGHHIQLVDLGQQPRSGSSAGKRVDLTVLRGIGRRGVGGHGMSTIRNGEGGGDRGAGREG
jgi:hypothetical protein